MPKHISFGIIGLIAGLIIGFAVANYINRNSFAAQQSTIAVNPSMPQQPSVAVQAPPSSSAPQTQGGGMMPDVAEVLEKAQNEPNNFEAQIKAGDMYEQIKRLDKAIEFYEKAHAANPEDYDTIVKLGNAYFDSRQFEKAEPFYAKALAQKPDDASVRADYGATFIERPTPDFERAIKEFQTSLETNPKHEPTIYNLGIAYYKKGDAGKVQEILTQLESINPQSTLAARLKQVTSAKQ